MKRIFIDTNVYAAFKRNEPVVIGLMRRAELIAVSTVILGELLAGFRCGSREEQNRRELDLFLDAPRVSVYSIDDETAEFYSSVFSDLKMKGRPIPSNDIWLAASTLQHGCALATLDGHFTHVSGLLMAL